MKKLFTSLLISFFVLLSLKAAATEQIQDPVEGLWLTENGRVVIEITRCDQGLCGHVYWIIADGLQYDEKNPDKTKRGQPMCGLPILWGFKNDGPGDWEDGKIYKADDGDMYNAYVELNRDGTLHVRGYMGIALLGKSQIWTRVSADDYPVCAIPAAR